MNIGERIVTKVLQQSKEDYLPKDGYFNDEIKDIKNLLIKIQKEIVPIKYKLKVAINYISYINEFLELVDQKLTEVQEKIFSPEGIKLNIDISALYLDSWLYFTFIKHTEPKKDICSDNIVVEENLIKDYPFVTLLRNSFLTDLFKILNIDYYFLLIACYHHEKNIVLNQETIKLKMILTNSDS